jgi:hypothetical protein
MTMSLGALVDANVLLDVLTEDPVWLSWSLGALSDAADAGPLWINPIIYAEVSVRFSHVEDLEAALPVEGYRRAPLPWEAHFWPARSIPATAARAERRPHLCPTSSSGLTLPWPISPC